MKTNSRRAFRPQVDALDVRITPSDLTPVQVQYEPSPLLTAPQAPGGDPAPLLTAPAAPDPFAPATSPAPKGPVSAVILLDGHVYNCTGTTNGVQVGINTTGIPCGEGDIMMVFPDGTTGGYHGMINSSNRLQDVQYELDTDTGVSTMFLPCNCTVPAVVPADLGLSA